MEAADMPRKKNADQATAPKKIEPGPRTRRAIEAADAATLSRPMRAYVQWEDTPDGEKVMASPHADAAGNGQQMLNAFGTASSNFMLRNLQSLEAAVRTRGQEHGSEAFSVNAALALMEAIGPQDELEGSLAVQIASNHALTMEMLCRAKSTDSVDHLQLYGNMAVKLQRTFTAQIEALARMRGKGQQTVRVEHVTVEPGGQAIVGDVHHYGRGAGASSKNEDQSHATGNSGSSTALPSSNPLGEGVPIAGGKGPEAVPHARRHKPRCAARKPELD